MEKAKSSSSPKLINQKVHFFLGKSKESITLMVFASHENRKPEKKKWRHPPNSGECSTRSNSIERLVRKGTKIICVEL